jgi:hypothetical protein
MNLHIHRNSFNAGEISPLMDARTDDAKHPFSCRIMENFLPKVYGGAFRRPGLVHIGTAVDLAEWTEVLDGSAHNISFASHDTTPGPDNDTPTYEIGSLWLRTISIPYRCTDSAAGTWVQLGSRHSMSQNTTPGVTDDSSVGYSVNSLWRNLQGGSIYKCTDATVGAATWSVVSEASFITASAAPVAINDSTQGYAVDSIWLIPTNGAAWICTDASVGAAVWSKIASPVGAGVPIPSWDIYAKWDSSTGYEVGSISIWKEYAWICTDATVDAAVWVQITTLHRMDQSTKPTTGDNAADGFGADSVWIWKTRILYRATSVTDGAAVWEVVSGAHNLNSVCAPRGADKTGYAVGSHWTLNDSSRAWELTSLTGSQTVRLIDFNISATVRYVLEFGDGYLRIWNSDGTPFIDKVNSPYNLPAQLATPYSSSEIFDVQIAQLGSLAYFAHPDHPPQKLERSFQASFAASVFAWSEVNWSFPAFRDTNISEVTATPSATSGGPVTISFTNNPFTETSSYNKYGGARILLSQRRAASHVTRTLVSPSASSDSIFIIGDYQVFTYGSFTGTLRVQAKDAAGAWFTLKSFEFTVADEKQIVYSSSTAEVTELRLDYTWASGTVGVAYLEAGDSRRVGYARILDGIAFSNSLPVVRCEVELPFDSTAATTEWAIESWAIYAGYPRAVAFHEQRLWFGGTEAQPNTVWASRVGDFENFRRGAFDADSLAFTLAAQEGSAIQSLLSHQSLVVFTQSEEWTLATSEQTAITPSNVFVRRQSRFGSSYRQAFVAANNLLFLQRGSRKLRQFTYSSSGAQGQASDLTRYAEHITDGGIRQMAFQQQPDPIIWAVTNNGVLLSFTFEPDENVLGWARHTSGTALFESVATIYGEDGNADEVWLTVNRDGTRAFERLDPQSYAKLEAGTVESMIYLDSSITVENDPASTAVSGLDHLEGETVSILADGAVQPSKVVSSGAITLDTAAETVIVGLPYVSILQPSKIEVAGENGTSQGKTFVCKKVHLNLWKTYGAQFADNPNSTEWFNVQGRSTDTLLGEPEPLFTGLAEITNLGNYREGVDFTLRQTLPLPCNVLAMIPQISISKE